MPKPFEQLPFEAVPEAPRVAHAYFATEVREVVVTTRHFGSVRTHVRVLGEGPPLVLVHGFMTTSYSFRYVIEPLARRFTVYAPDLVGCGRTDKPDASYEPDAIADWLAALADELGVRGAAAIGNSLGGYLAMRAALRHEDLFSRLVCLHAPGIPTARMWALRIGLWALPGSFALVRALVRRDPERWVHHNVHYFDETLKSREEHREYAAPLRTDAGLSAFYRQLDETLDVRAMARFAAELERRGAFPIPLLLVYAERDPMVPPSIGAALARALPAAGFVQLEGASHFAHVDAPEGFLGAIDAFLGEGLGTRAAGGGRPE